MMLRQLIIRKWFWLLLYAMPFLFYVIPMLDFVPEWNEKRFFIYWILLFVASTLFIGLNIFFWITQPSVKRSKKIILTIATVFVLGSHCLLFFITDVQYHFTLKSKVVIASEILQGRNIYLIANSGLFNVHESNEIGYKTKFLPLYRTYYSTSNFLEVVKKDSTEIIFNEYEQITVEREIKDIYDLFKRRETTSKNIRQIHLTIDNLNQ